MDRNWAGSTLIFDIWEHFDTHVVWAVEQLRAGGAVKFCSTGSAGVALDVEVTTPSRSGYLVAVDSPDLEADFYDRLRQQGWSLRGGDDASMSDLRIERTCADAREIADTLTTALRGSLGMRNPWFIGLAPADYSIFAFSDGWDMPFDPHASTEPMDLLMSLGFSLYKGYGPFVPMMVDGVFRVSSRTSDLFLRTEPEAAEVWFSWVVKAGDKGRRAAKILAGRLNDQSTLAHFIVEKDEVWARYGLPAEPFVPGHLFQVINSVGQGIASVLDSTNCGTNDAAAGPRC